MARTTTRGIRVRVSFSVSVRASYGPAAASSKTYCRSGRADRNGKQPFTCYPYNITSSRASGRVPIYSSEILKFRVKAREYKITAQYSRNKFRNSYYFSRILLRPADFARAPEDNLRIFTPRAGATYTNGTDVCKRLGHSFPCYYLETNRLAV